VISRYYKKYNANTHSGVYRIAEEATEEYIKSKKKVAKFINASEWEEIVYTRNTTESINLVARTWAEQNIQKENTSSSLRWSTTAMLCRG